MTGTRSMMMKAVMHTRYGPPGVLRIREVPRPEPKEDEVLVRVHATTVTVDPKRSPGPLDLPAVIRYARGRGIGIILYDQQSQGSIRKQWLPAHFESFQQAGGGIYHNPPVIHAELQGRF